MEYRRKIKEGQWHFCELCSQWPKMDYYFTLTAPLEHEICSECLHTYPAEAERRDGFTFRYKKMSLE